MGQFQGALQLVATDYAESRKIPLVEVSIQDIKRRATGKGNAGKDLVIEACNTEFGAELPIDNYENTGADNVADATWALVCGIERFIEALPLPPISTPRVVRR